MAVLDQTSVGDVSMRVRAPSSLKFCIAFGSLALPLVVIAIVAQQERIDPSFLLRDPLAVARSVVRGETMMQPADCCKAWFGMVSQLGGMIWLGVAAILAFTGILALIRHLPARDAGMLLWASAFTGFLAIDDMLMLHENAGHLGLNERIVFSGYAMLMVCYFFIWWRNLMAKRAWLILVSLAFFSLSVVVDIDVFKVVDNHVIFEDGFKFAGITTWAGAQIILCLQVLSTD